MDFKFSVIILMCFLSIVVIGKKYEHISDCSYVQALNTPGLDTITFICGEKDNENKIHDNATFSCSEGEKWVLNTDISTVEFKDCRFPKLKRNYLDLFWRMLKFNISNLELETLQITPTNIPDLITLDVSHNNLRNLSEMTFVLLANLKHLDLSFNPIGNLDVNVFKYVDELEDLKLRKINITNIKLGTFASLQELTSLDLSENNLKKLDFANFYPVMHHLRILHLDKNQLSDINGFRNTLFPQLILLGKL